MRISTCKLAACVLAVLIGTAAPAAVVTVDFGGTIDFIAPGGAFEGHGVDVGGTFSGTYSYSTNASDSDPSADVGQYNYTSLGPAGMTVTLTVGSLTVSTSAANPNSGVRVLAFPTFDEYRINTILESLPNSSGNLSFDMPINWGGGQIVTDALPLTVPDISLSTFNELLINDSQRGQFAGVLTYLEVRAVPLPAGGILLASALLAATAASRRQSRQV